MSVGLDIQLYTPIKLSLSREAQTEAMAVFLEATNAILPSQLCLDRMVPLTATLAIFKATLDRNSIAPKDKEQVAKVGN